MMTGGRIWAGMGLGAMIAAGLGASPALFAQEQRAPRVLKRVNPDSMPLVAFGSFTPAAADPRLTAALSRHSLNIGSAYVATFGEKAVDVFYVTDLMGAKVQTAQRQAAIRKVLTSVLEDDGSR